MEKFKRKIQKKKGDLKMRKTGFYLLTLLCTALLCLGTVSYVNAKGDATSRGRQRGVEKKDNGMFSELSKEEKQWLAAHPKVIRAMRKKFMAKRSEVADENKDGRIDRKRNKDGESNRAEDRRNRREDVRLRERKTDRDKKLQSLPVEEREEIINKRIKRLKTQIDALEQML